MAVSLMAPWWTLYREISAMFAGDSSVRVMYNPEDEEIKLYVDDRLKASALEKVLIGKHVFGDHEVNVTVIPNNCKDIADASVNLAGSGTDFSKNPIFYALEKNAAVDLIADFNVPFGNFTYVVFKAKVVQFFNDDLGDINGNCTTLYQEIAKKIFKVSGVYFCTAPKDGKNRPLGEWP